MNEKKTPFSGKWFQVKGCTLSPRYLPSTENRPPPPAIVLSRQLKVGQGHRDAGRYPDQNSVNDEKNSIEGVLLPTPEGCKDVIHFHWYGTVIKWNWKLVKSLFFSAIQVSSYIESMTKKIKTTKAN